MHTANLLSVALASAMLAGRAATQVWQPLPATAHPPIAGALAMAHDPLRQRTICCADEVMFSGPGWAQGRTSTWEWDGTRWLPAPTATTPTPTAAAHALAYEPLQQRVVLVNALGETWRYDGLDWQLAPLTGPLLVDPSLAYDRARGTLVLAGAGAIHEPIAGAWTVRATFPSPLVGVRLGFDPIGNRMLAFGGSDGTYPSTTWSWDGTALAPVTNPGPPTGRVGHQLVTDDSTGRLVLLGGADDTLQQRTDTVFAWDGTSWVPQPSLPDARARFAAAHDGTALLLFGGDLGSSFAASAASAELLRGPAGSFATVLLPTAGPHSAHDSLRNRTVSPVDSRTLEFDGTAWSDRSIPSPPAVTALAFHDASSRLVACTASGTTWLYDGSTWTATATGIDPPPRENAGFAYDPLRQRLVLFGGVAASGPRNDIWEWDGANWSSPSPTNPPPAGAAALGWDPIAARLVMVREATGPSSSYAWDGTSWTTIGPVPGLHRNRRVATHPQFGLVMLANQAPLGPESGELALLTGNSWTWLPTTLTEKASRGRMVFDTNRGELLLHDDRHRRSWILTLQPATAAVIGTGCTGSAGVPVLRAANLPQLGALAISDVFLAAGGAACFVLIDTATVALPLPGGCTQGLASPIVQTAVVTGPGGHANATFVVPSLPALRGLLLYEQALTLDPNGSLLGFASLTATLRLQIGD